MSTEHTKEAEDRKTYHYSIKTVDGSRYDVDKMPYQEIRSGIHWFVFSIGNRKKYINVKHVVSVTEVEEDA